MADKYSMERDHFNYARLNKLDSDGKIVWSVILGDPEWYKKVAEYESRPKVFDLEIKEHRIFSWGNYKFVFPVGEDGNVIFEIVTMLQEGRNHIIPEIPMLRVGMILTDEAGEEYEIMAMEPLWCPPGNLKGIYRIEPKDGIYSAYGWLGYRYLIEKRKK